MIEESEVMPYKYGRIRREMDPSILKPAENVNHHLGHLHNIAATVQIGQARTIWMKAHRAFQTARCEQRRRRTDKFFAQLHILAQSSQELLDIAKQTGKFPDILKSAQTTIEDLSAQLDNNKGAGL